MGFSLTNPSSGIGSGETNIVRVATIAARDLLTPDGQKVIRVQDASADINVGSGVAWYQWDNVSAYEMIAKGEESRLTAAELAALISSLALEFVGGASYSPDDPDELETDYPAASNSGKWGIVWAGDARDGLYRSNGTLWIKLFDDSGDRTELWDYQGGVDYAETDELYTATANAIAYDYSDGSIIASGSGWNMNNISDGNDTTYTYSPYETAWNAYVFAQPLDAPKKIAKFRIGFEAGILSGTHVKILGLKSLDVATWDVLTPLAVDNVEKGSVTVGSDHFIFNPNSWGVVTIEPPTIAYAGYALFVDSSAGPGAQRHRIYIFEGYELIDSTQAIDCVLSINKLNDRLETLESDTAAADAAAAASAAQSTADSAASAASAAQSTADSAALSKVKNRASLDTGNGCKFNIETNRILMISFSDTTGDASFNAIIDTSDNSFVSGFGSGTLSGSGTPIIEYVGASKMKVNGIIDGSEYNFYLPSGAIGVNAHWVYL